MAANRPQTSIRLDVSLGSNSELSPLARDVRCTLKSRRRQAAPACPFRADSVAKVFLGWRPKFSWTTDAFRVRRYEGPHRFTQKRLRTFVAPLQSFASAIMSKNQPSR